MYHNLKVRPYVNRQGKKVWGVVQNDLLVSTVRGLSKKEANKQLGYYSKIREFKFVG
jgi:hypothetical protein